MQSCFASISTWICQDPPVNILGQWDGLWCIDPGIAKEAAKTVVSTTGHFSL